MSTNDKPKDRIPRRDPFQEDELDLQQAREKLGRDLIGRDEKNQRWAWVEKIGKFLRTRRYGRGWRRWNDVDDD